MKLTLEGGRILRGEDFDDGVLSLVDGRITAGDPAAMRFDASGLTVLPGVVDIHGDAFERQIMPRPGVHFPLAAALLDTDRQMVSNGITTAFHGITCSWEPGLRSRENFLELARAIHAMRAQLACDTRVHLRFETFNLEAVAEAEAWLRDGLVELLAFNDHTPDIHHTRHTARKAQKYMERTGLSAENFCALVESVYARAEEVPAAIAHLSAAARAAGVPMLSHDDETPSMREDYHRLGCRVAEFPKNEETARRAVELGNPVVMGAPNVVRGGSHNGAVGAQAMVEAGLCQVLASDYYYPAPLLAAYRLAATQALPLEQAWRLVSLNPARAAGLHDRGEIAEGRRADLVMVDDSVPELPRVVATVVAGRLVFVAEPERLAVSRGCADAAVATA